MPGSGLLTGGGVVDGVAENRHAASPEAAGDLDEREDEVHEEREAEVLTGVVGVIVHARP